MKYLPTLIALVTLTGCGLMPNYSMDIAEEKAKVHCMDMKMRGQDYFDCVGDELMAHAAKRMVSSRRLANETAALRIERDPIGALVSFDRAKHDARLAENDADIYDSLNEALDRLEWRPSADR